MSRIVTIEEYNCAIDRGASVNDNETNEVLLALRLLVGGAFLIAGWNKIWAHRSFEQTLRQEFGLHRLAAGSVATVLPWLELALGAVIVVGVATQPAGVILSTLLCLFTLALLRLRLSGRARVECSCFGTGPQATTTGLIVRNVLLLAASITLVVDPMAGHSGGADRRSSTVGEVMAILFTLSGGALTASLWASLLWITTLRREEARAVRKSLVLDPTREP